MKGTQQILSAGWNWDPCGQSGTYEGPTWASSSDPLLWPQPGLAHDGLHVGPTRIPYGQISGVLHEANKRWTQHCDLFQK